MHSAYRAPVDPDQPPIAPAAKIFTAREANGLLAELRPIVSRMREAAASGREAGEGVRRFAARMAETGGGRPDPGEARAQRELAAATAQLETALQQLHALGVRVKDPARGLVDLLGDRDGEVVELCWLDGEPEIAHWHRIGEGFAGRRPIDEDVR
jgi:hypothetical protein